MEDNLPRATFSKPCQTVSVEQFLYLTKGVPIESRVAWLQTFHPWCYEGKCKFVVNQETKAIKCVTHGIEQRYFE